LILVRGFFLKSMEASRHRDTNEIKATQGSGSLPKRKRGVGNQPIKNLTRASNRATREIGEARNQY
jgi:hypothetical protein